MIAFLVLLAGVLIGAWRIRRHRRADTLAGLNHDAPAFMVSPPSRSVIDRQDYRR